MPNYKESAVAGTKWTRSWQVNIDNKYQQIPTIAFFEEEVVDTGDGTFISKMLPGALRESFSDPSKSFNLLNPATGNVIGTASYQDLYVILSSLYSALAELRDNPPAVITTPVEPPVEPPV